MVVLYEEVWNMYDNCKTIEDELFARQIQYQRRGCFDERL